MANRATPWKEGKIVSIETRKGVFVLAQMLKNPFLRFYNHFREDENWNNIDVSVFETLFVNAVTGTFLKHSKVSVVKNAIPDMNREDSKIWIKEKPGHRKTIIWKGTKDEKEFYISGSEPGGALVEKDLWWSPSPEQPVRSHSSGVIDAVIQEEIALGNNELIDKHELTGLGVFPLMNERLYQCYKAGKNVDPLKYLVFDKEIPKEFQIAIEIISGGGGKENKEKIISTYFR